MRLEKLVRMKKESVERKPVLPTRAREKSYSRLKLLHRLFQWENLKRL